MANRSISFIYSVIWVFAAAVAFLIVVQWDEAAPLPTTSVISVFGWDESEPAAQAHQEIEEFAREQQITVGFQVTDFEDRYEDRNIYLIDGDPDAEASRWIEDGYRDFTASLQTHVYPYGELGSHTIVGSYLVFSEPAKAHEFAAFLSDYASAVDVVEIDPSTVSTEIAGAMLPSLAMMALVAMAIIGAGVLVGIRAYGVGRLQGVSYGGLLLADLRRIAVVWAGSVAAMAAIAAIALYAYNGLASVGTYFAVFGVIGGLLTAVALAAHTAMLLLVVRGGILTAVKGELPGKTVLTIAYSLRLIAVGTSVVLAGQALVTGLDLERRSDSLETYEALGDTSLISVGGLSSIEEEERLEAVLAAWLREEDRAGNLIMAGQETMQSGHTAFFVNDALLEAQPIESADGTVFEPAGGEVISMLIPETLAGQRSTIEAELTELVEFALLPEARGRVSVTTTAIASGQELFTYTSRQERRAAPGTAPQDHSFATDPIIVAVPDSAGLLRDGKYIEYASGGNVVFPDPAVVTDAAANDPELAKYLHTVTPVAEEFAEEYRKVLSAFRLDLFGALAGAAVLAITGVGVALVQARRGAQWIFTRHVNGWRFAAVHRALLSVEAVVLAVMIAYAPLQVWWTNKQALAPYEMAGVPAPFEPAPVTAAQWAGVALLAAVAVGGLLFALSHAHRRVVRDGASEA